MAIINLSNGGYAIIDDDVDSVLGFSWFGIKRKHSRTIYVARTGGKNKPLILLHRVIINATRGVIVDHVNGNGLDNRLENLRIVSHSENMWNARKSMANKSGVKGVWFDGKSGKYMARVNHNRKSIYLGMFISLNDASRAVYECRNMLHGEFANYG